MRATIPAPATLATSIVGTVTSLVTVLTAVVVEISVLVVVTVTVAAAAVVVTVVVRVVVTVVARVVVTVMNPCHGAAANASNILLVGNFVAVTQSGSFGVSPLGAM
jgi:hypothetical protein